MSGTVCASHSSRTGSRALIPFTLNVAILIATEQGSVLLVSLVALTRLDLGFRRFPNVLGQGFAYIIRFLEAPLGVATDVALVGPGIDKLAFGHQRSPQMTSWQTPQSAKTRQRVAA